MLGKIRLVNPYRGISLVAEIETWEGKLSFRTNNLQEFDLYWVIDGKEFWSGKTFSRRDLLLFSQKQFSPNHPVESWNWKAFGVGEYKLKGQYKPKVEEIAKVSREALKLEIGINYPILDIYECWVCDKDKLLPLFLALCAPTREEIETLTFSPMFRLERKLKEFSEGQQFEEKINSLVNTSKSKGRFGFTSRIYRRNEDGSLTEFFPNGKKENHPQNYLSETLLVEPFNTEYQDLKLLAEFGALSSETELISLVAFCQKNNFNSGTAKNAAIKGEIPGAINPSGRQWLVPSDCNWKPKEKGWRKKSKAT